MTIQRTFHRFNQIRIYFLKLHKFMSTCKRDSKMGTQLREMLLFMKLCAHSRGTALQGIYEGQAYVMPYKIICRVWVKCFVCVLLWNLKFVISWNQRIHSLTDNYYTCPALYCKLVGKGKMCTGNIAQIVEKYHPLQNWKPHTLEMFIKERGLCLLKGKDKP